MRIAYAVRLTLFAAVLGAPLAPASAQTPELTAAERDWLKRHGPIRVGAVGAEGTTIDMLGTSGEYLGITADYLRLIQDRFGLKIAIVRLKTRDEVMEAGRARRIDMAGSVTGASGLEGGYTLS